MAQRRARTLVADPDRTALGVLTGVAPVARGRELAPPRGPDPRLLVRLGAARPRARHGGPRPRRASPGHGVAGALPGSGLPGGPLLDPAPPAGLRPGGGGPGCSFVEARRRHRDPIDGARSHGARRRAV